MTITPRRTLLLAVMVLSAACSGGDGSVGTTPESTVPPEGSDSGGEGVGSTPTTDSVEDSTTTTTVVAPLDFDIPAIEVTTPTSGEGPRPELSWEPVPETVFYLVTVYTPSGDPYWAWQGEKTAVHVGGEPQLEPDAAGPSVVDGMTWEVVAVGPSDEPLAASGLMEISP